jgi:TolB protein
MRHRPARVLILLVALVLPFSLWATPASATFPGQNGPIVFMSDRTGLPDIFAMRPDGTGQRNLTNSLAIDLVPNVSPDGEWIAWIRIAGTRDVWLMRHDGTDAHGLTSNEAQEQSPGFYGSSVNDPDPSGCFIFACNLDLFVQPVPGGPAVQLTSGPAWDGYPRFSPDGTRLVFASDRSGALALWTMNTDGTGLRRITRNALHSALPEWSPDGTRIVFADNFCATCGLSDIWIVNADGSGLRRILEGFHNELDPVFSPDGRWIAFSSGDVDILDRIWLIRPDGTGLREIKRPGDGFDEMPDWSVKRS